MDRSEGNDEELYPRAPLPAHERPWRHPSEVGERAWADSEPPLTIGRGLSAATGVIGTVLALAVLWTMLPTHAGRTAVSVQSTSVNTIPRATTVPATDPAPTTTSPTRTTEPSTTTEDTEATTPAGSGSTLPPGRPEPLPTYAVTLGTSVEPVAVAVSVNDGSLVLTTASAVRDDNTVALLLPDGSVEQAEVLLVDQRSGFAVLAHDDTSAMASFTVASGVQPGDTLTIYGADGASAVVQDDGTIATMTTDPAQPMDQLPEGTPVVNEKGELVALCSHADGTPTLISLEHLDSLRKALATDAASKVWIGVSLDVATDGTLSVASVDPTGPAAEAGAQVGDVIRSVNGVPVTDLVGVGTVLVTLHPGDTITVVVGRKGSDQTLSVTLAAPKATI